MNIKKRNTKSNKFSEIKSSFNNFKFKSINLTLSKQLTILGSVIGIYSLFSPWIKDIEKLITWNSFYSLSGNIGYLLILILIFPIFITLSTNNKEKVKLYSDLSLKNHFIIITSGIFIISFSIISLSFVNGLHTFFENIIYGKGIILCLTSGIIILISGLISRKQYYLESSEIILNKLNQNRGETKEKNNMKLPF